MKIQNKQQIKNLLIIEDPTKESIYGIVGRMELLIDFFKQNKAYHGFIPFLYTYYLVTKAVAEKYITHKHYFRRIKDLEVLDVYFASLYFKPLLTYLEKQHFVKPWEECFSYNARTDGKPFIQVITGINAHINTDLYATLLHLNYKNQHDFFVVNDILTEVIPGVMRFLAQEHDPVGFGGMIFKNFFEKEFHLVIARWRSVAWANAILTKKSSINKSHEAIAGQTEKTSEKLIEIFTDAYHLKNLNQTLPVINNLFVHI